ncbi:MAG TPA: DUF1499 domain-containing protein [Leptospiraceae bacterium]|nr:DUF1499 domain-containing protein [Leptospiraceae bacterium]HMW04188.1 DUF1499 domain-containing protein [Leptospiraceae bacterium]HMX32720.1 DUF1499 domain-containing protein [Leptospiraceae bacterium]HMY30181.1 DUF1499 domain-containing protein [Leptospiraceae bacterium]HMZ65164.1 DUF1499 domain-containing protein [Leptospiraceae bacterium]
MAPEPILTFLLICCSSFIGPRTGVYDGELNYCPPTPNCVSSQSWKLNPIHSIRPYQYENQTKQEAYDQLKKLLDSKENVHVMADPENFYIRTYYFTKVFRFPDKVEFLFEENQPIVQIRSASVFGIFDIFHNRIRMEYIRKELGWL